MSLSLIHHTLFGVALHSVQIVATVSMFLAGKAEETPRWLSDLVVVAYKLVYKWDPSAPLRIRQKVCHQIFSSTIFCTFFPLMSLLHIIGYL